jgi:hypothetical protein
MGDEKFTRGQRVNVEIDGRIVESIFVREAAAQDAADEDAADVKSAASGTERGAARMAWVRRSDTGEVEPVEYDSISLP